jgi:hypothetical protein
MGSKGNELYRLLIELTGLEASDVQQELDPLLKRLGMSPETLTMDEVRKAMATWLDELTSEIAPLSEA